jgi:hypothetical protein
MNLQSQVKYSVYYMLRETVDADVTVQFGGENEEFIIPGVVIREPDFLTSPLQLGGGTWFTSIIVLEILTDKIYKRDKTISDILIRVANSGVVMIDYSPYDVGGVDVSNFPYDPPDSNTVNPNYDPSRIFGYGEFNDVESTTDQIEKIENVGLYRSIIRFAMNVAYE